MDTHATPEQETRDPRRQTWLVAGVVASIVFGVVLVLVVAEPARSPTVMPGDAWSVPAVVPTDELTVGPDASSADKRDGGRTGTPGEPDGTRSGRALAPTATRRSGAGPAAGGTAAVPGVRTPTRRPAGTPRAWALPGRQATTAQSQGRAVFTARYRALPWRHGYYIGQIVVRNVGAVAGAWTVELRLSPDASIVAIRQASYQRVGPRYRFGGGWAIPPGGSLTFSYLAAQRDGRYTPRSCSINGDPCQ